MPKRLCASLVGAEVGEVKFSLNFIVGHGCGGSPCGTDLIRHAVVRLRRVPSGRMVILAQIRRRRHDDDGLDRGDVGGLLP